MKNGQTICFLFLGACFLSLGCNTPPVMMNPDADPMPTAMPSPSPEPTMPPKSTEPPMAEVPPYCEMKILDSDLLIEKSSDQITDIRVAANDKGFAITWRNNKSAMPLMFRSFNWDHTPTSDVVHLGDMYLNWGNGLIGGKDDYLTVESKFEAGIESPPQPFKYTFHRISMDGERRGFDWPQLQLGEREPAVHAMFDGKYYRVTAMRQSKVGCPTYLISYQVSVTGVLVHYATKCIYLPDDPVNAGIRSLLPMEDDVLVAYDQHLTGAYTLPGSIKIVGLTGSTDWEPASTSAGSSFFFLEGAYNTPSGMKMLWLKAGERFISSLDDGKITKSYGFDDPIGMPRIDGGSVYGVRFNQLDNTSEFLRTDLKGKTMSKIDIKSPITDPSYAMDNRNGRFVIANFSWWGYKKPELRTISCQ